MRTILCLLLSLLWVAAHAIETLPGLAGDGSYRPYWSVKTNIRSAWQRQQNATLPLYFDQGLQCTGVFIGSSGEMLTNLHCLEECLVDQGLSKIDGVKAVFQNETFIKRGAKCSLRYGSRMSRDLAEVLHVFAPGWLNDREKLGEWAEQNQQEYFELLRQGFDSFGDLVVIRLPIKNSTCVNISYQEIANGDAVMNISYPILFRTTDNPREPLTSLGLTQMWSYGQQVKDRDPFTQINGVTLSSVDAETGASGSPMFNMNGELVSLLRSTFKGNVAAYVPWSTQGVHLVPLRETMAKFAQCK